jgi:hypothetical protein
LVQLYHIDKKTGLVGKNEEKIITTGIGMNSTLFNGAIDLL